MRNGSQSPDHRDTLNPSPSHPKRVKSALLPQMDLKAKIFDVTMKVVTMDVILSQSNRIFDYVQVDWMPRRPKVTRYLLGSTLF